MSSSPLVTGLTTVTATSTGAERRDEPSDGQTSREAASETLGLTGRPREWQPFRQPAHCSQPHNRQRHTNTSAVNSAIERRVDIQLVDALAAAHCTRTRTRPPTPPLQPAVGAMSSSKRGGAGAASAVQAQQQKRATGSTTSSASNSARGSAVGMVPAASPKGSKASQLAAAQAAAAAQAQLEAQERAQQDAAAREEHYYFQGQ